MFNRAFLSVIILFLCSCASSKAAFTESEAACKAESMFLTKAGPASVHMEIGGKGCKYDIIKVSDRQWMLELANGEYSGFTPKADVFSKKAIPVIKKSGSRIILFSEKRGILEKSDKKDGEFYFKIGANEETAVKGKYITSIQCMKGNPFFLKVNGDGVFGSDTGCLYDSVCYVDLYDVKVAEGFYVIDGCSGVSGPNALKFPNRIRFTADIGANKKVKHFYNANSAGIAALSSDIKSRRYIMDVIEERTPFNQKIKILFNAPFSYDTEYSDKFVKIKLKGIFLPIKQLKKDTKLQGSFFKSAEIAGNAGNTEIILNKRHGKDMKFSSDKHNNSLIIYGWESDGKR